MVSCMNRPSCCFLRINANRKSGSTTIYKTIKHKKSPASARLFCSLSCGEGWGEALIPFQLHHQFRCFAVGYRDRNYFFAISGFVQGNRVCSGRKTFYSELTLFGSHFDQGFILLSGCQLQVPVLVCKTHPDSLDAGLGHSIGYVGL
jgi:hypothetical protein